MGKEPLVSIIIPIYKVEEYIKNTIESVIKQTYKNIEIILVDDGSPDNSVEIAETILRGFNRKYVLIRQKNAGQGVARNAGLKIANGEWIFFLDSDDMIVPSAIKQLVAAIGKTSVDVVFSDLHKIYFYEEAIVDCLNSEIEYLSANDLQYEFLLRRKVVLAPGSLYRKLCLNENNIQFDDVPWSEDQHFIWRILKVIKGAAYVYAPLYQYFQRPGSIMSSTKSERIIKSYPYICQLSELYEDRKEIQKFLVPRWVMGTANSTTLVVTYKEWRQLLIQMEWKKSFRTLLTFPDMKVRCAACLGLVSLRLYYLITRKRII